MGFARLSGYNGDFRVKNADIESTDYGKSKTALYSWTNMTSYAQMSQNFENSSINIFLDRECQNIYIH